MVPSGQPQTTPRQPQPASLPVLAGDDRGRSGFASEWSVPLSPNNRQASGRELRATSGPHLTGVSRTTPDTSGQPTPHGMLGGLSGQRPTLGSDALMHPRDSSSTWATASASSATCSLSARPCARHCSMRRSRSGLLKSGSATIGTRDPPTRDAYPQPRSCHSPPPPGDHPCRGWPAGRSVPGRGGPERRRRPQPDRTGASVAQWCWSAPKPLIPPNRILAASTGLGSLVGRVVGA
jgi:hypothetical protein